MYLFYLEFHAPELNSYLQFRPRTHANALCTDTLRNSGWVVTQVDQRVAVSNTATRAGEQHELRIEYVPSGEALRA